MSFWHVDKLGHLRKAEEVVYTEKANSVLEQSAQVRNQTRTAYYY